MLDYNNDFSFSFLPSYRGVDFILKLNSSNGDLNQVFNTIINNGRNNIQIQARDIVSDLDCKVFL